MIIEAMKFNQQTIAISLNYEWYS